MARIGSTLMNEIFLKVDPAFLGQQTRAHAVVRHRNDARPDAQAAAQVGGHRGQGFAVAESTRPLHVKREVTVAELEPCLPTQRLHRLHEGPGFVVPTPAEIAIGETGEGIGDGIDVRRDRQAEMFEIVPGVHDDQQFLGRQNA